MDVSSVSTRRPPGGRSTDFVSAWEWRNMARQERTSLTFCGSPMVCVHTRLIRTLKPPRVSHTHSGADWRPLSRSESESVQDLGSNSSMPHIFPSSCRDSWNARLPGSEILTRTYTSVERRVGKIHFETHAIQILDEPGQILSLQAWNNILVFVPTEEVDELPVKLRRGSVEVVEWL